MDRLNKERKSAEGKRIFRLEKRKLPQLDEGSLEKRGYHGERESDGGALGPLFSRRKKRALQKVIRRGGLFGVVRRTEVPPALMKL